MLQLVVRWTQRTATQIRIHPRRIHSHPRPSPRNSFSQCYYICLSKFTTKKALRGVQTLCTGCSKAEPKIFAPPQTPFPVVPDGQNLISWRWSLPLPTNPVWWRLMHAISSYRGNRPTSPVRHRQGRLQYTAPQLSARCKQVSMIISEYQSWCVVLRCRGNGIWKNEVMKVPGFYRGKPDTPALVGSGCGCQ